MILAKDGTVTIASENGIEAALSEFAAIVMSMRKLVPEEVISATVGIGIDAYEKFKDEDFSVEAQL